MTNQNHLYIPSKGQAGIRPEDDFASYPISIKFRPQKEQQETISPHINMIIVHGDAALRDHILNLLELNPFYGNGPKDRYDDPNCPLTDSVE